MLSLRGVSPYQRIVVYEGNSGMSAARAFWFLEYLGGTKVSVLDGGLQAWKAAGLPVQRDAVPPAPTQLEHS